MSCVVLAISSKIRAIFSFELAVKLEELDEEEEVENWPFRES